jgi:hypothetical protein
MTRKEKRQRIRDVEAILYTEENERNKPRNEAREAYKKCDVSDYLNRIQQIEDEMNKVLKPYQDSLEAAIIETNRIERERRELLINNDESFYEAYERHLGRDAHNDLGTPNKED